MAKGKTILIKLVSSAGTGYFYAAKKNPTTITHKLAFMKVRPPRPRHRKAHAAGTECLQLNAKSDCSRVTCALTVAASRFIP